MAGLNPWAKELWRGEETLRNRSKPQGILRFVFGFSLGLLLISGLVEFHTLGWILKGPFMPGDMVKARIYMGLAYCIPLMLGSLGLASPGRHALRLELLPVPRTRLTLIRLVRISARHGPLFILGLTLPWLFLFVAIDEDPVILLVMGLFPLMTMSVGHGLGSLVVFLPRLPGSRLSREPVVSRIEEIQALGLLGFAFLQPRILAVPVQGSELRTLVGVIAGHSLPLREFWPGDPAFFKTAFLATALGLLPGLVLSLAAKNLVSKRRNSKTHHIGKTGQSLRWPACLLSGTVLDLLPLIRPSRLLALDFILSLLIAGFFYIQGAPRWLLFLPGTMPVILGVLRALGKLASDSPLRVRLLWAPRLHLERDFLICALVAGLIQGLPFLVFALVCKGSS